jgi:hypothetical protein
MPKPYDEEEDESGNLDLDTTDQASWSDVGLWVVGSAEKDAELFGKHAKPAGSRREGGNNAVWKARIPSTYLCKSLGKRSKNSVSWH